MGSSGLREDRGPTDYDRTGPPVPEPLSVIRLYLKSPCALKLSQRCASNASTPVQQLRPPLNPVRDNLVKTNVCLISFEAEMHCQGCSQKATGIVFNIRPGHSPSSFSFIDSACVFL